MAQMIDTYVSLFRSIRIASGGAGVKVPIRKTKVYPKHKTDPNAVKPEDLDGFVFGTMNSNEWKRGRTSSLDVVHKSMERGMRRARSSDEKQATTPITPHARSQNQTPQTPSPSRGRSKGAVAAAISPCGDEPSDRFVVEDAPVKSLYEDFEHPDIDRWLEDVDLPLPVHPLPLQQEVQKKSHMVVVDDDDEDDRASLFSLGTLDGEQPNENDEDEELFCHQHQHQQAVIA